MSKYIIVAGSYRSGTTALFNIIRLILKHSNVKYDAYFWNGHTKSNKEYQLIKTHTFSEGLCDKAYKIFVAHRKFDDVYNSMLSLSKMKIDNKFINAANVEDIEEAWMHSKRWINKADYIQNFINLTNDVTYLIQSIAAVMGITNFQLKEIVREFTSLKAPVKGLDEVTLLTETHRKQQ